MTASVHDSNFVTAVESQLRMPEDPLLPFTTGCFSVIQFIFTQESFKCEVRVCSRRLVN